MGAKGGQIPQPTMGVTDQRNESWGSQGKMYPLKGRPKNQWGGYGKQYGASSERRVIKLIELIEPNHKTVILLMGRRDRAVTSLPEVLGVDRVVMGEMERKMIKGSIEILELVRKVIVMKRVIQKTLMSLR